MKNFLDIVCSALLVGAGVAILAAPPSPFWPIAGAMLVMAGVLELAAHAVRISRGAR